MDPLGVILIAVAAFGAGIGVGLWVHSPSWPGFLRRRAAAADDRTSRTMRALDALAADSIRRLAGWVLPARGEEQAAITLAEDGTITLLFSDIAASTALNLRLGDDAFASLLGRHDTTVRRLAEAHDGHVVKTHGDGFLAVFHDPHDAIAMALDLQEQVGDPETLGEALVLRIGIHTGQAVTEKGDVFGGSVAFAARVADTARSGEVLVSAQVRGRVEPEVDDLQFSSRLLPSRLKGIPGMHNLHRVERTG